MAPGGNKDMRRADLIVPYMEPPSKAEGPEFSSTLSSTLPMAAMFTRNKFIGWAALVFSIQSWLGESEDARKTQTMPGFFNVGMAFMSLGVTYMPLFMPPQTGSLRQGTGTEPAPPVPQ